MKYVPKILLFSICVLLQAACSNQAVYTEESFADDSPFKMKVAGEVSLACESARRSLLGQGYLIESANSDGVKGRKAYKSEGAQNTFIEMNVVCLPETNGTTLFATGVLTTYALKKSTSSASVGLSALGSISLPIGQSADSLVKVSEETIDDKDFYKRFFGAVSNILGDMQAEKPAPEPVVEPAAPEPAPAPAVPVTAPKSVPAKVTPVKVPVPPPAAPTPAAPVVSQPVPAQPAPAIVPEPGPAPVQEPATVSGIPEPATAQTTPAGVEESVPAPVQEPAMVTGAPEPAAAEATPAILLEQQPAAVQESPAVSEVPEPASDEATPATVVEPEPIATPTPTPTPTPEVTPTTAEKPADPVNEIY